MFKIIRILRGFLFFFGFIILSSCQYESKEDILSFIKSEFSPETYVCYRINSEIKIDGILEVKEWESTPWTNYFVDIEGDKKPLPLQNTRVKMLWDDEYFYIAAELEETDIWANLTERESVIFYDNDFEVFIDPSGDTHQYYELEINALETIWDLMLIKPYRDGGPAVNAWDIRGLKSAIHIDGSINDPSDTDVKWTIELAIPFKILKECAPYENPPKSGDQWRVNFSRVHWKTFNKDGKYIKQTDPSTGKNLAEFNWVWSQQGVINLHIPEMWGYVQFSSIKTGQENVEFLFDADEKVKWALRQVYYQETRYLEEIGIYSDDLKKLGLDTYKIDGIGINPDITVTDNYYIASLNSQKGDYKWFIRPDGLVWKLKIDN